MNTKSLLGKIMPAGPLMKEHRIIENMIALLKKEAAGLEANLNLDTFFISQTADFIMTYVDRCHHGKEEHIFFRELEKKNLSKEHSETMGQLMEEHKEGRILLSKLMEAAGRYEKDAEKVKTEALSCLNDLTALYPRHIEKEDMHFFLPCMNYFSRKEKDDMLEEFWEFDRMLIHEKYRGMLKQLEIRKLK